MSPIMVPYSFMNALADGLITISFFLIPCLLVYLASKKRGFRFTWIPALFIGFLFFCGLAYLSNIVFAWHPYPEVQTWIKFATALLSVFTTVVLFRIIPKLLSIPSSVELEEIVRDRTNSMIETIEELKHAILVRQRIEAELKTAKEAAENATRTKSQFLANMSHEIRTPLGIMLNLSEQIGRGQNLSQKQQDLLSTIQRNGKVLSRVINDVLDLSKIEAGKLELDITEINVDTLIGEIIDTFKFRAQEKGLLFNVATDPATPTHFLSDELRLKQILINLLTNAFKHTQRGTISLRCRYSVEKQRMVFEVEDTGSGIAPEHQGKVFEAFEQADTSRGGTGLGLTLSKRFAQMLGGSLILKSSELDRGTIFELEIPDVDKTGSFQVGTSNRTIEPDVKVPRLEGRNLLVVDDNEDNLLVLELLLSDTKANVVFVTSGQEALLEAQRTRFDLILMDLQMPNMDGFATLEHLRQQNFQGPVWAVSAYALKEDIKRSRAAGFAFHVTKPIQSKELYQKLNELFLEESPVQTAQATL